MTGRANRFAVLIVGLTVSVFPASARQIDVTSRTATGTGRIAGVVVTDEASPQLVRGARVTLHTGTHDSITRTTTTDEAGRFSFESLPAGVYILDAMKPSLVSTSFASSPGRQPGSMVVLSDAQPAANVTVKLARGAVISGTVRDQDGQPLQGAYVSAMPMLAGTTLRAAGASRGTATDDRGRYRLYGLPPGTYLVGAERSDPNTGGAENLRALGPGDVQRTIHDARSGSTPPPADPANVQAGRPVTWLRVLYPGTPDQAAASPISVVAGEERTGIDLALSLVTTRRIEGVVLLPAGTPAVNVRVTVAPAGTASLGSLVDADRTARTDGRGKYAISGLTSGTYDVLALNTAASPSAGQVTVRAVKRGELPSDDPPLWAATQAVVAEQDLTIALTMQPGVNIHGQLVFEGAEPTVLEVSRQRVDIRSMASSIGPPAIPTEPTGKFELAGVIPGRYVVGYAGSMTGRAWALKSATADGVDVLNTPMDVRAAQDIRALVLTLTARPSTLGGTLVGVDSATSGRYTIVVFPTDRALWTSPARVRQMRPGPDGAFKTTNLPAGEYFVSAVLDLGRDWNTAAALERAIVSATKATVVDGRDVSCEIRVGG